MSEDQSQPFEIGDLVRLNQELKQLRENLKRKRAAREQARRDGKRLQVDLTPEIERLSRFLTEIDRVSVKLKGNRLPLSSTSPGENNDLSEALRQVKAEIENEKKKLEAERTAREQENVKHQVELQLLKGEIEKSKELLNRDQRVLGNVVAKTVEQSQKLQPEPVEPGETKSIPSDVHVAFSTEGVIAERPAVTTRIEPNEMKNEEPISEIKTPQRQSQEENNSKEIIQAKIEPQIEIRRELDNQARQNEELRRDIQARVTNEFTAIRSEIQILREQISREQDMLDTKRRDLDLERSKLEEERRALQAKISETFTATRTELNYLREQISRKQEELELKQNDLYEQKVKIDEEKRLLKERAGELDNEHLRFMTRKMIDELQNERSELTGLKRSLQQLRADSASDRKRLQRDRDSILKARLTLENEKRKTAWKNALIEIKARQALLTQKPRKKPEHGGKETKEPAEKDDDPTKLAAIPAASTDGEAVVLGVRLGDGNYAIEIGSVREIIKRQPITPLPRQPSYIEGIINVRGTIIPVVNLRRRFDLKGESSSDPHTVIVDSSEGLVGILVDSVSEVIRLPRDSVHPAPPIASGMDGEYLRGICKVGEQLLLYLDVEKVLRKATPISALQGLRLGAHGGTRASPLTEDEKKLLKVIPTTGIIKSRLKNKTKCSDGRISKAVSSLRRRGLVRTHKEGKGIVISRTPRPALRSNRQ